MANQTVAANSLTSLPDLSDSGTCVKVNFGNFVLLGSPPFMNLGVPGRPSVTFNTLCGPAALFEAAFGADYSALPGPMTFSVESGNTSYFFSGFTAIQCGVVVRSEGFVVASDVVLSAAR